MGIINNSYTLNKPEDILSPLICDVPHAGTVFPDDFNNNIAKNELRKWEDAYVDELASHAPNYGIPLLCANIHRTYIDVNRHILDIDPKLIREDLKIVSINQDTNKLPTNRGILKRIGPNGENIHKQKLSIEDMDYRIISCYIPYHACLSDLIDASIEKFGKAYHINMHSMFSHSNFEDNSDNSEPRADFIISNNYNETCEPAFTKFVKDTIENMGYSVSINDPFSGGEIVCMYGNPKGNVHSLQIEIKKSLYMDQLTMEKHREFKRLSYDISRLLKAVAWWSQQSIGK